MQMKKRSRIVGTGGRRRGRMKNSKQREGQKKKTYFSLFYFPISALYLCRFDALAQQPPPLPLSC
jgi:hypothetical protein